MSCLIAWIFVSVLSHASAYIVSTLAGNGTASAIDGIGISATFNAVASVVLDSSGNVFVADRVNNRLRKITPAGVVTTFAGNGTASLIDGIGTAATFNQPTGLAIDSLNNIYVADVGTSSIRKVTPAGVVTTVAGNGTIGFANGPAASAMFYAPNSLTVDPSGNIYVVDWGNNCIRLVTPSGIVSTLAGNGTAGSANGVGTSATFYKPSSIVRDSSGNLYVTDRLNNKVRLITPSGVVSDYAGNGTAGTTDGNKAVATFNGPAGITIDPYGNFYIADRSAHKIRMISTGGVVSTVAGNGTSGFADGNSATAMFNNPFGVAVDSSGNLYIGEYNGNRVRVISAVFTTTTTTTTTTTADPTKTTTTVDPTTTTTTTTTVDPTTTTTMIEPTTTTTTFDPTTTTTTVDPTTTSSTTSDLITTNSTTTSIAASTTTITTSTDASSTTTDAFTSITTDVVTTTTIDSPTTTDVVTTPTTSTSTTDFSTSAESTITTTSNPTTTSTDTSTMLTSSTSIETTTTTDSSTDLHTSTSTLTTEPTTSATTTSTMDTSTTTTSTNDLSSTSPTETSNTTVLTSTISSSTIDTTTTTSTLDMSTTFVTSTSTTTSSTESSTSTTSIIPYSSSTTTTTIPITSTTTTTNIPTSSTSTSSTSSSSTSHTTSLSKTTTSSTTTTVDPDNTLAYHPGSSYTTQELLPETTTSSAFDPRYTSDTAKSADQSSQSVLALSISIPIIVIIASIVAAMIYIRYYRRRSTIIMRQDSMRKPIISQRQLTSQPSSNKKFRSGEQNMSHFALPDA